MLFPATFSLVFAFFGGVESSVHLPCRPRVGTWIFFVGLDLFWCCVDFSLSVAPFRLLYLARIYFVSTFLSPLTARCLLFAHSCALVFCLLVAPSLVFAGFVSRVSFRVYVLGRACSWTQMPVASSAYCVTCTCLFFAILVSSIAFVALWILVGFYSLSRFSAYLWSQCGSAPSSCLLWQWLEVVFGSFLDFA